MNRNITATILIILAGAVYFTYTSGVWKEAQAVKVVNDQYVSAIKNAETLIALRKKVTDDYNAISAVDKEKIDKILPNTVDNIRLIIDMNNVALQNGLSLKNISASAKSASSGTNGSKTSQSSSGFNKSADASGISVSTLDTVSISFSVSSSYQQFISLMQALEANMRLMDITHLTVSTNDAGAYEFSVQLNTYWLRQ